MPGGIALRGGARELRLLTLKIFLKKISAVPKILFEACVCPIATECNRFLHSVVKCPGSMGGGLRGQTLLRFSFSVCATPPSGGVFLTASPSCGRYRHVPNLAETSAPLIFPSMTPSVRHDGVPGPIGIRQRRYLSVASVCSVPFSHASQLRLARTLLI